MTQELKQEKVEATEAAEVQQTEAHNISYAEFVRPLVQGLRDAIIAAQAEEPDKYNEFDIYNSLALTVTMLVSSNISEEDRKLVNDQSIAIAKNMTDAALETAQKDLSFLSSILIGASRSVTNLVEIVESSITAQEQEVAQEETQK